MGVKGCSDFWCEYYGKGNEKCDRCVKKETERHKPDLAVVLKRRAVEQMELSTNKSINKSKSNEQIR